MDHLLIPRWLFDKADQAGAVVYQNDVAVWNGFILLVDGEPVRKPAQPAKQKPEEQQ